jgi:hypothetical protein
LQKIQKTDSPLFSNSNIMRHILTAIILALMPFVSLGQTASISLPIKGVYQAATSGNTPIVLAGQYLGSASNYRIEYQVIRLYVDSGLPHSIYSSSSTIVTNPTYGLYRTTLNLPIGWYEIVVNAYNISAGYAETANRIRVGVGDVYLAAGQSNAQGYPESGTWALPALTTYEGIMSHDVNGSCNPGLPEYPVMSSLNGYNRIAPSGNNSWYWTKLGQDLQSGSPAGGRPISFFNAAAGGSTSVNWKQSSDTINTFNDYTLDKWCGSSYTGKAQPYFDFKTSLHFYASIFGIKAVLWHQGEGDNNPDRSRLTDRANYRQNVYGVINKSRSEFSNSLRWLVSEASYQGRNPLLGPYSTTRSDVILAQNDLTLNSSFSYTSGGSFNPDPSDHTFKGVLTDGLTDSYRDVTDKVHFREDRSSALSNIGNLWSSKIGAPSGTYSNILATTPPHISMVKSGSSWTLTVPAGYSEYRWMNMSWPNTNTTSGVNTLSGSGGGRYACLVKDASGKWNITQTVYTSGCPGCREGIAEASAEWSEPELGISTKAYPLPFDRNFTIEFTIPSESTVRLEIIGANGTVIKKLSENVHAKGTYKYPVQLNSVGTGILFYVLYVNDLAISRKLVSAQ